MVAAQRQMHKPVEQEHPEMILHLYGQLICNKEGKNIQWGKDSLFNK